MIIKLKSDVDLKKAESLAEAHRAIVLKNPSNLHLITSGSIKTLPVDVEPVTESYFTADSDIQLASRAYDHTTRAITVNGITLGGDTQNQVTIAGPCSVESKEQMEQVAKFLTSQNVKFLRAGCFKPRTSPYTFQGLGQAGIRILSEIREQYGFSIVTEVKDASHVALVIEHADMIQIGTKAMYDHQILKMCGKTEKPILLKRGFGSTLQEFVQAAEFILSSGNPNVILCERGIRTFESKTRFTLDLCGVAYLKEYINLPVIVDPSHAMGYSYGVPGLARAATAMGVEGLLIETHPEPDKAKSDASQQLDFDSFEKLMKELKPIAEAVGKTIV